MNDKIKELAEKLSPFEKAVIQWLNKGLDEKYRIPLRQQDNDNN